MNQGSSAVLDLDSTLAAVEAAGLFSSVCTVQSPSQAPDALGQPDLVDWSDVAGIVGVPCMMSPLGGSPSIGDEQKRPWFTSEKTTFHLLLDGYFPQIRQRYRAVVDGTPYDIMGTESDSQKVMTRLALQGYSL
jgi:hypothetical protein